jgi:hypothetical protein
MIRDWFGDCPEGEDRFDALVGLYGMIDIVQGNRSVGEPLSHRISMIDGWIFGQDQAVKEIYFANPIR